MSNMPMRRSSAIVPRFPSKRRTYWEQSRTTAASPQAVVTAPHSVIMECMSGDCAAFTRIIAREDGPAMRGTAMGTIKGSSFRLERRLPLRENTGNTMPRATMNSMTPPEILSVAGFNPRNFRRVFPQNRKTSRISRAKRSSLIMINILCRGS